MQPTLDSKHQKVKLNSKMFTAQDEETLELIGRVKIPDPQSQTQNIKGQLNVWNIPIAPRFIGKAGPS